MPKIRLKSWEERIEVFLLYRRNRGKIYPTATKLGLSRSTVLGVVKVFLSSCFSNQPRADVSDHLLSRAQELHEKRISQSLNELRFELTPPEKMTWSEQAIDQYAPEQSEASQPEKSPASQDLLWHLRSTTFEDSIRRMESALRDYEERCKALWLNFASRLENGAEIRLIRIEEWQKEQTKGMQPALFDSLVDVIYKRALEKIDEYGSRPIKEINWRSDPDSKVLRANGIRAAVGDSSVHENVQHAVKLLEDSSSTGLDPEAFQVRLLYEDLEYLNKVILQDMAEVTEADLKQGICPRCPYPEVAAHS